MTAAPDLPDALDALADGVVATGHVESRAVLFDYGDAVNPADALRTYFDDHPDARVDAAVAVYRERDVTVDRAADLAGLDHEEMRATLDERDVPTRLGVVEE